MKMLGSTSTDLIYMRGYGVVSNLLLDKCVPNILDAIVQIIRDYECIPSDIVVLTSVECRSSILSVHLKCSPGSFVGIGQ